MGKGRDAIEAGEDEAACCLASVRVTTVDGDTFEYAGESVIVFWRARLITVAGEGNEDVDEAGEVSTVEPLLSASYLVLMALADGLDAGVDGVAFVGGR